ncbi:MAG: oxygenase MpaB family protein [Sphingomonas sp.]|uniref:oxygenase MpaB family protein n=1 Tax=Sphingomonas sp. TaxID=28214 RepID=UPI00356440CD
MFHPSLIDPIIALPSVQRRLDASASALMRPPSGPQVDFTRPEGEAALVPPDSVSWRVFKNPLSLFIGGVAAVILELAEPAVRTGVWEHSSFRSDPVTRLQRTGLAAMMTVYGPRSQAEATIAGVVRRHAAVSGATPDGEAYQANDPVLLTWVQATASYGFCEAYHRYAHRLSQAKRDRFYAEAAPSALLYGAVAPPADETALYALFDTMRPRLEASPILFEFLDIIRAAPAFPAVLRPLQRMLVRAAVDLVPGWVRDRVGLGPEHGLRPGQATLLKSAVRLSDRLILPSSAAVQSSRRMALPADYLFRRPVIAGA